MARFRAWTEKDIQKKLPGTPPTKKKIPREKKPNPWIDEITAALTRNNIPWKVEYRFHPVRKWRFDIVIGKSEEEIQHHKLAIEFNGGAFTMGRHTRGTGYTNDLDKITHAQIAGFRVLQYTNKHLVASDWFLGTHGIVTQVKALMR